MDHNSIIDRKNYDIYKHSEDYPKAFICDKPIAPAVALLNKKGYKTFASCSGHYKVEFYEWFDEDLNYLEEVKSDKKAIIKKINENSFDYWTEVKHTHIYILFNEKYNFESLPTGFELNQSNDDSKTLIECVIDYYDENDERKKRNIVEKEIDEKCDILKKWADNLPERER